MQPSDLPPPDARADAAASDTFAAAARRRSPARRAYDRKGKGDIDEKQRGCGAKQSDELPRHLGAADDPPFADGVSILRQAAEDLPAVVAAVCLRILAQKRIKRVAPQRYRRAVDRPAGKQVKPAVEQRESQRQKEQHAAPRTAALIQHPGGSPRASAAMPNACAAMPAYSSVSGALYAPAAFFFD